jgi:hypothetical protein
MQDTTKVTTPAHVPTDRKGYCYSGEGDKSLEGVYIDYSYLYDELFQFDVGTSSDRPLYALIKCGISGRKIC